MQNKILIIGNGFDLYHKLPTGYKDFLFFAKNWKIFKDNIGYKIMTKTPLGFNREE